MNHLVLSLCPLVPGFISDVTNRGMNGYRNDYMVGTTATHRILLPLPELRKMKVTGLASLSERH